MVHIRPVDELSQRFPAEMPCRIRITLTNGQVLTKEKRDYEGFQTRPMQWETVVRKFEQLSQDYTSESLQAEVEEAIFHLESVRVHELAALLEKVKKPV